MRLARVGIERVIGYLAGGIESWKRENPVLEQTPQISVQDLDRLQREKQEDVQVVDVRRQVEWEEGHIQSAMQMPLSRLVATMDELDGGRLIAVHCKGGYRSSIAASLLQRAGFPRVLNVKGGFDAWKAAGRPAAEIEPAKVEGENSPNGLKKGGGGGPCILSARKCKNLRTLKETEPQ
jgi:rhodanese-related sulfurtransferase